MPHWYYNKQELEDTPSIQDGIDKKTECRYRKEGAKFIFDTGTTLGLGYNTMATGVMYFHRFYMFHSFREFPRFVTASACIFLAGKVEETPKLYEDIIKTAKTLLDRKQLWMFGKNPRKEIMTVERIILHTIKFDLLVEHPNNYIPKYAKCLRGNQKKIEKIVQSAWNFASDSLYTTLALQWEPQIIAIAFMYLAGKLSKFTLVDCKGRLRWWDNFVEGLSLDLLEDICHQLLDSYSQADITESSESSPTASVDKSPNVIHQIQTIPQSSCPSSPMKTSKILKFSPPPEGFPSIHPPADFSIPPPPLPPSLLGARYTHPPGSIRPTTPFPMSFTHGKPPGSDLRHPPGNSTRVYHSRQ